MLFPFPSARIMQENSRLPLQHHIPFKQLFSTIYKFNHRVIVKRHVIGGLRCLGRAVKRVGGTLGKHMNKSRLAAQRRQRNRSEVQRTETLKQRCSKKIKRPKQQQPKLSSHRLLGYNLGNISRFILRV